MPDGLIPALSCGMDAAPWLRMRWVLAACVVLSGGCAAPSALSAEDAFTCEGGTIRLPAQQSINESIDATDCVVKITGLVNGSITATGGVVHVVAAPTVNGELVVDGAREVVVQASQLNGGIDIEHSTTVTVEGSSFNGEGRFVSDGTVTVTDSSFNGSLTISDPQSCTQRDNQTNGTIASGSCN
jgi:hypothetical protein